MKVYNTLSRSKEEFKPIKKDHVGFYACGPTVYLYPHIGNLRTFVFEDILKRVLIYNNFKVKHVMNITDVGHLTSDRDEGEDKIEVEARKEGKTAWEVAKFYTKIFKEDIKKLNILEPNVLCNATDHIKEQIGLVKKLEKKELTYEIENDGIYFDTSKIKDYGKLARLDIKGLKAGARVRLVGGKRNPTDFALWKFSPKDKKRDMEWKSPWSKEGFPGWYIECSAMSMKYLGDNFDIHCGGADLIPIHNTNEIAQSEAVINKEPWVKYWLHGAFLLNKGKKVSKSKGGLYTISELEEIGYDALDFRYLCLLTNYRKELNFSLDNLDAAKHALQGIKNKMLEFKDNPLSGGKEQVKRYEKMFLEKINDDLNMPEALAVVWTLLKDNELGNKEKYNLMLKFDKVLGLGLKSLEVTNKLPKDIGKLIEEREEARRNKDFNKADRIRDNLKKIGVVLEDTDKGVKWKYGK